MRYTIFKTKWGYFGLSGNERELVGACLPMRRREDVNLRLLKDLGEVRLDKTLFRPVQEQIRAYFEGAYVNFDRDIPIVLDGLTLFTRQVLTACRGIRYGQTISYGKLAEKAERAAAARAVGNALAGNPLPLIIPCHRVVCANGKIGGFSALGGVDLKAKLLRHEQKSIKSAGC